MEEEYSPPFVCADLKTKERYSSTAVDISDLAVVITISEMLRRAFVRFMTFVSDKARILFGARQKLRKYLIKDDRTAYILETITLPFPKYLNLVLHLPKLVSFRSH